MFSHVHNWPHGYWTARPCYGAVGTHPIEMLSCKMKFSLQSVFVSNFSLNNALKWYTEAIYFAS